jgi:hypothetical protein
MSDWRDDDEVLMAARRHAATLSDDSRFANRGSRVVPVRASAPGRDFALEPIGPGWTLYSTASEETQMTPVGVCVEVVQDTLDDYETGERIHRTRYRCIRRVRGSSTIYVDAGDVDTTQLAGLDRTSAWTTALWLLQPLIVRQRWTKTPSRQEAEAVHDAWALTRAVLL